MTTPLRIQAADADVLALTSRALELSQNEDVRLTIRCAKCGHALAFAGYTKAGPLFTSRWTTPRPGYCSTNGRRLSLRQEQAIEQAEALEVSGDEDADDTMSVLAILQLPSTLPADYPDLLVRCNRDGDLLLDRTAVLERLRDGGDWRVTVALPRYDVAPADSSWIVGESNSVSRRTTRTIRYGPRSGADQ